MRATISTETLERLAALGAATIHEAQGQCGAMASAIKPIDPTRRLVGRALTVDTPPADNLMIHHALTQAQPGDVLVVDAKGFTEGGPWGDILTLAAQKAGVSGLVIDGMVRDGDAIIEMGFPIFCRGLCIKATHKAQAGRVNEPIVCAGVRVEPGDVIVGDRDGVVVVAQARADAVLAASQAREDKEEALRADLNAGRTTVDLLGLDPTLSRLGFR